MVVVLPRHLIKCGSANAQETRRSLIIAFASVEGTNDREALHLVQGKNRARRLLGGVTKKAHECHHPLSWLLSMSRCLPVEEAMLNN
jgi:hypothetical protein